MNTKQAKKALQEVARQHGVSEDEVRREIEAAIVEARSSKDPAIQAYWKAFPCKGEYPTPEEVIAYLSQKVKKTPMPEPSKKLESPQEDGTEGVAGQNAAVTYIILPESSYRPSRNWKQRCL